MGMFDSVFARCPFCTRELEFQTKSGDCRLDQYTVDRPIPAVVVLGALDDIVNCCNREWKLSLTGGNDNMVTVRLKLLGDDGKVERFAN